MQSATNPTLDANAQHPPEIREDDPRHLKNLMKNMNKINSQVSSDTKYDPAPPPRVDKDGKVVKESFIADLPPTDIKLQEEFLHILRAGVLLVFVGLLVTIFDSNMRNYAFSTKSGPRYLLAVFFISSIALLIISESQRRITLNKWYPNML
jgi:hypothetical protein